MDTKTNERLEAIANAVTAAVKEVGIEKLKKASWFGSNHSDPAWVAESEAFLREHGDE